MHACNVCLSTLQCLSSDVCARATRHLHLSVYIFTDENEFTQGIVSEEPRLNYTLFAGEPYAHKGWQIHSDLRPSTTEAAGLPCLISYTPPIITQSGCRPQAQEALPAIEQKRRAVQAQLGQVGSSLGRFGRDFVANTTEMFEQVRLLPTVADTSEML